MRQRFWEAATLQEAEAIVMHDLADFGVPEGARGGIVRYLVFGVPPGGFLMAVLRNDLFDAIGRADDSNARALKEICAYLYNCAPTIARGMPSQIQDYMAHRQELTRLNSARG